jgi:hypothetical protein
MRSLARMLALLLFASGVPCVAQDDVSAMTNMQAYQRLSARIGDSLSAAIPTGDSARILLSVKPEATAWLTTGGVAQQLQKAGHIVVFASPWKYQADLAIIEMRVTYRNVRKEGLFSGKVADREVLLNVGARLIDQKSGTLTLNRELRQILRDTVELSEIPSLEDPNVSVTQGVPPDEGFFSSLVEPLILLGAVAVAVYLLFTVRS